MRPVARRCPRSLGARLLGGLFVSVLLVVLLVGCAQDTRTVVTVYTPHGRELMTDLKARFEREHPTIDVQWVDLASQAVLDRVRAEKSRPNADVWFGAPSEMFDRAANEGLLAAYTPSWADAIPADAKDTAGFWYGTYLTPEVIGYNTVGVRAADAPRDWSDLASPRWKGKLLLRDPVASGTMQAIFGAILQRSISQTGNTEQGWRWLERVDANTREYTASATDLYQKLGRRLGVVTMYSMPDLATLEARLSMPVKVVIPSSGTPLSIDGIAILRGAPRQEEAKIFVNFVASREVMLVAARDHLRMPARNDVPPDSLPKWIRDAQKAIVPMALDRQLMADSLAVWMTAWDARVRNRFRGK